MFRSIVLIFFFLLCFSEPCKGLEITFKAVTLVEDMSVKLSDIAIFDDTSEMAQSLGSQIITQSPAPGQEIQLQTEGISSYLIKTLSLPLSIQWQGPEIIRVQRKGINIGPDKILSIISDFIDKHKNDLPEADIRFIPSSLPLPFLLPTGNVSWEITPSHPGILSSSGISLIFSVDGHVRRNISVAGHFEALAPVVVAASSIKRGTILTQEHVKIATKDIADSSSPCLDPRDILGKKTNRNIKEGNIIERVWVDSPPMVIKGQMVKIIINHGNLHLSTTGMANMNGSKDQVIRVLNINSKKLIFCRVTAPGIVEVQL
jgi:flagellar basal body P-ring formation protein FlgA